MINKTQPLAALLVMNLLLLDTVQCLADSVNYLYDSMNRIIEADYADGSKIQYTYDTNGNRLTQTLTAPAKAGTVDAAARSECLFNWAESHYPGLFAPKSQITAVFYPYRYRHYVQSNAYIAISMVDDHIYYMGASSVLQDEGTAVFWWQQSGC